MTAPRNAMPFWVRCIAALAVVAFLLSMFGGILGAQGWWQASGVIFAVLFAVVWGYQLRQKRREEEAAHADEGEGARREPIR